MSTNNLPDVSVIEKATLRGIGNAIREKTKGTSEIPVPDMAAVIKSIKSEPKLTEITATPSRTESVALPPEGYDGFSKVTLEAAKLQNKTVTPGVKTQAVLPEGDAIGLFQVTVKAVELEEKTVTPTTEEQVFTPSGDNIGFSKFTVKAAESGGGGGEELQSVMEVSF